MITVDHSEIIGVRCDTAIDVPQCFFVEVLLPGAPWTVIATASTRERACEIYDGIATQIRCRNSPRMITPEESPATTQSELYVFASALGRIHLEGWIVIFGAGGDYIQLRSNGARVNLWFVEEQLHSVSFGGSFDRRATEEFNNRQGRSS